MAAPQSPPLPNVPQIAKENLAMLARLQAVKPSPVVSNQKLQQEHAAAIKYGANVSCTLPLASSWLSFPRCGPHPVPRPASSSHEVGLVPVEWRCQEGGGA